jgi:hypothetical protein
MSNANLKPNPSNQRINPGNRAMRLGFMTLAVREGVEIALYHPTMFGLENAFNAVTSGRVPFDRSMVSRVEIRNQREGVRA